MNSKPHYDWPLEIARFVMIAVLLTGSIVLINASSKQSEALRQHDVSRGRTNAPTMTATGVVGVVVGSICVVYQVARIAGWVRGRR